MSESDPKQAASIMATGMLNSQSLSTAMFLSEVRLGDGLAKKQGTLPRTTAWAMKFWEIAAQVDY